MKIVIAYALAYDQRAAGDVGRERPRRASSPGRATPARDLSSALLDEGAARRAIRRARPAARELQAEQLGSDRVSRRVDAVDQVVERRDRRARAGVALRAARPPGELLDARQRIAVVVHATRLVVLNVAARHLAVFTGGGRDAGVAHAEAAAKGHARHRVAVAALVVDALPQLLLRLVDLRLHLEVGEAFRARPAGETALLEDLLDAQQMLHAGLADRLLAVIFARVAQIALVGKRRRAIEVGAARRGLVEAAVAHLEGMRGIQCGHELEQLGLLPAG